MTDNKNDILCPACGKPMTKLNMSEAGVDIDICLDGCGGIYFDNRELEKFDEAHENIDEIIQAIKNKHFNSVDDKKIRTCPVCDSNMSKFGAANGEVEIDVCNNCGGKFLDNGELNKIREAIETSDHKLEDILQIMFEYNLDNVTKKPMFVIPGNEKRKEYFINLAKSFHTK